MPKFLDPEFTDLLHPELPSLGLVALDGGQHYMAYQNGSIGLHSKGRGFAELPDRPSKADSDEGAA